ncbi:MAG: 3-phosphoshikimate 1-carboxyvinyltransferase [bacterium]|nr:3-phosphoshikimate 1-carboxyvinyltransferase [bacterium]
MSEGRVANGPVQRIDGRVEVPASKSLTNRALIAAAVAGGGEIQNPLDCEDTRLLAQALSQAGWPVSWNRERIQVGKRHGRFETVRCDLGNSGTGSRLLLGLLAATDGSFVVDGTPRLRERPMAPLIDALRELGAEIRSDDGFLPVSVKGCRLEGGELSLRPQVSSQFVTSLVMAAPLMRQGLNLTLEGEVPSRPYLELTLDVLEHFGNRPEVSADGSRWRVSPAPLVPSRLVVEGDWSAAAFFLCAAGLVASNIEVIGVDLESRQGDRAVCDILCAAGVEVVTSESGVRAVGPAQRSIHADLTHTPDLFPALVALAATLPWVSVFRGLDHLKHKESDRLTVMVNNLGSLGGDFEREGHLLRVIRPIDTRAESKRNVTAAADHRIAMAMALAASVAGPLLLDDPQCVQKSFPGFWDVWQPLLD